MIIYDAIFKKVGGGGGGGGGTEKQLRILGLVGRGQHFPCSPFLWGFYLPTTMASILRVYKAFLIFEKKILIFININKCY